MRKLRNSVKKIFLLTIFVTSVMLLFLWVSVELLSLSHDPAAAIPLKVKNQLCSVIMEDKRSNLINKTDQKMIYFVTPTYPRPAQIPELTRLSHTLMHVPHLHWIVADDQNICSETVSEVLRRTGLPYTHISSPKPFIYKTQTIPRGVSNRRAALDWIIENVTDGILYFGDDDNTYDLRLFQEIRRTKRLSMFPVGLVGEYGVSSPVVGKGQVVAFYDSWPNGRTFPVDMAGFAINIEYLKTSASMPYVAGAEEDKFLVSLDFTMQHIEPLAHNCSKIYVWHTQTVKYKKRNLKLDVDAYALKYAEFASLLKETVRLGLASIFPGNGTAVRLTKNGKSFIATSKN